MPVDPGIYQNMLRPAASPMDYASQYTQQAGAAQNLLMQRAQLAEHQRSLQEQGQIRNALMSLGGGASDEQRVQALRGTGLPGGYTMADSLEKSIGERAKTAAQTKKDNAESAKLKMATLSQVAQGALLAYQQGGPQAGQQAYQAGLQAARASGQFDDGDMQRIAPQFDPQGAMAFVDYDKALTRALTMRGQDMTAQTASEGHQVTMRGQDITDARTRSEGAANRGVTMRGQNLTDARAREATSAQMSKPFEVTDPSTGQPVLVQQDKQGNITPVQGYAPKAGADKPLNDSQAKANLFGTRMQEADKTLTELTGKYSPAAVNSKMGAENLPLVGGVAGMVGNAVLSGENQRAEQAQRDFVNAVLRRESGAVISPSEFANAQKQYFPQPNDKPETLAQKARNRKIAIEGLMAEVPQAKRGVPSQTAGVPDDIAALLKKHGGK